jgi:cobalt-zinc-cadmium efflux system outer membrane protein
MESYRRSVLPDLVRYYRGVFDRRQIDPNSAFGDLVFAQQNLATNVTAYIGILGSLWSSVVTVADFLQTDNLFQTGEKRDLPQLPDFRLLRLSPSVVDQGAPAAAGNSAEATSNRVLPGQPDSSIRPG